MKTQATAGVKITLTSNDLIGIDDAAHLLNVHRATLYRWINRGQIATVRIGKSSLIPITEIQRLTRDSEGAESR